MLLLHTLLFAMLTGGCSVLDLEIDAPFHAPAEDFHENLTDYHTVLAAYGPPSSISALNGGAAFLYEHLAIRENQIGFSFDSERLGLDYKFLDWTKFAYGKAYADREALLLVFNADGVLTAERFVSWRDDLGTGFAVQMLVEVAEIVDTSSVQEHWDANMWGAALLRSTPEVLNSGQSLDLGQAGLELRGAPDGVGQHTLEMRSD